MKGEALSLLSTTRLPKSILWLCGANKISQDSKLHCIRASVTCQTGLKKIAKTELPIGALRGPSLDPTQLANGFSLFSSPAPSMSYLTSCFYPMVALPNDAAGNHVQDVREEKAASFSSLSWSATPRAKA